MTDASGTVVWAADYKPFGEATITVSTITNNLRFPGQYFDAETGLNYNYSRDYNPIIGRYIEADPIGIIRGQNHLYVYVDSVGKPSLSTNLYAYTDNNPVNWVDELGLQSESPLVGMSRSPYYWYYQPEPDVKPVAQFSIYEAKCMLLGDPDRRLPRVTAPVFLHTYGEIITQTIEHHPNPSVLLKTTGEVLPLIGWGYFSYEAFECVKKCGEVNNGWIVSTILCKLRIRVNSVAPYLPDSFSNSIPSSAI